MDTENIKNINETLVPEIPPNDFEAEQAVISSMLFDTEGIALSYDILSSEDFYRSQHKVIFDAIIQLYSENDPVDLITLKNKLEQMDKFDQVGGMEYLVSLFNIVSTSANVAHYAQIIKEKSTRRKILDASKQIHKFSFDNTQKVDQLLEKTEKLIENISSDNSIQDFAPVKDVLIDVIERLETLYKNKSKITGVETGFADFDTKTSGLQQSDFILIAARPSMGKTAFALNIAQYAAIHKNVTTAIFSLEMSKEQLLTRMMCSEGLLDSQNLRTGSLNEEDWVKLHEVVGILYEAPLYIDDTSSISISEIRNKCRKLKKEKNLGLIVIDYLQLMTTKGKTESRQQEISTISRELKGLARELDVPVVALSQLSRAVEQRKPARPMLSDLRESGAIEQDADIVCFLYRDEYYNPETEKKGLAEVIIAKQRNGSIGSVDLRWIGKYTKFTSVERVYTNL